MSVTVEVFQLNDWQWWASAGWFGLAIVGSFMLPGLVVLNWTKIARSYQLPLAPAVGIALWGVAGYLAGWLHIRWVMFVYPLVFLFLCWQKRKDIFPLVWRIPLPRVAWIIMGLGVISQLVPVWGSGWRTATGIDLYTVNIYDGMFHLSLSRMLVDRFPPEQPGAAGLLVTNYHYLSNLVIADLARVWQLPLMHVYFQFMPLLLSIVVGVMVMMVARQWSKQASAPVFALALYYVVGELSWIFHFLFGRTSPNPFEVFIDNGVVQLLNPPQAFAKIIFFAALALWFEFNRRPTATRSVLLGVLVGTLFSFKIYFGLTLALILIGYIALRFLTALRRREGHLLPWKLWGLQLFTLVAVGAAFYLPTNAQAGGLFWAFLHWPLLWLGATKLNWNEWWLRLQVYQAAQNSRALFVWYSIAVGVFFASLFHLRSVAVFVLFKRFRGALAQVEALAMLGAVGIITFIGMNFLQISGGANIFNFFVVALAITNLLTSVVLSNSKRFVQAIAWGVIGITVVQSVWAQSFFLDNYRRRSDRVDIPVSHENLLRQMETLPRESILQAHPQHYLDRITPYLYFFTGHQSYFGGGGILNSHNQPVADRKTNAELLFALSATESAQLAKTIGVTHLFFDLRSTTENDIFQRAIDSTVSATLPHWQLTFQNEGAGVVQQVAGEQP